MVGSRCTDGVISHLSLSVSVLLCSVLASFSDRLLHILPGWHPQRKEGILSSNVCRSPRADAHWLWSLTWLCAHPWLCRCSWGDVTLMSTPEVIWTENGKWVIPQGKIRVLFPEERTRDAGDKISRYPYSSLPSLSLKLSYFLNLGRVNPGLEPSCSGSPPCSLSLASQEDSRFLPCLPLTPVQLPFPFSSELHVSSLTPQISPSIREKSTPETVSLLATVLVRAPILTDPSLHNCFPGFLLLPPQPLSPFLPLNYFSQISQSNQLSFWSALIHHHLKLTLPWVYRFSLTCT